MVAQIGQNNAIASTKLPGDAQPISLRAKQSMGD